MDKKKIKKIIVIIGTIISIIVGIKHPQIANEINNLITEQK